MANGGVQTVDKQKVAGQNTSVMKPDDKAQAASRGSKPEDPIEANGKALGLTENCTRVLRARYLKKGVDGKPIETPEDLFRRVARAVALAEERFGVSHERVKEIETQFYRLMVTGEFMPNSPTLMNAGREMGMLSACFVLPIGDSIDDIFNTVKATALIQRAGGGTGFSFDRLRPTGDFIRSSGGTTSGPISFWRVLSEATNAIQQGAFRRGANMGMMTITHPDILKFIEAKQDLGQFTNYNISVKVTDAWMEAYRADRDRPHVVINPRTKKRYVMRRDLDVAKYQLHDLMPVEAYEALPEKEQPKVWAMGELYDLIIDHAWQTGEPGVIFIDRVNQANPTPHVGEIEATNPCGEQPLLPYEACNLGSVNLGLFAGRDKEGKPTYDWEALRSTVRLSTRFLDDIIEINNYPLPEISEMCQGNRKIGLGIMGFADALFKLGVAYNSEDGVAWGERFMKFVNDESHAESEQLAEERGCFPNWEGSSWDVVHHRKMRNACTTTVAPTGTISIIANCSGGVEPLFSLAFFRNVLNGQKLVEVNPIFKKEAQQRGFYSDEMMDRLASEGSLAHIKDIPEEVRKTFVCAHDITPEWHVRMQAAFQKHCDSSISKTTNFPHQAKAEDVRKIYDMAYELRCKGITVYRDGCRKGQPMALKKAEKKEAPAPAAAPVQPKPMGKPAKTAAILSAVRIRQRTAFGHMHVSITVDPKSGRELEVFAQLGKAGDVTMSDLEAICRMVSLFLRAGGSVEHVMDQLEGIGSNLQLATRDGKVMSLGDALGKTIRKYWNAKKQYGLKAILLGEVDFNNLNGNGNGNGSHDSQVIAQPMAQAAEAAPVAPESAMPDPLAGKTQTQLDRLLGEYKIKCPECGSGTLTFMEGCVKCPSCGFSQC